jgi:hypothetical protein
VCPTAAGECTPELGVELQHEDQDGAVTHLKFAVNISVSVDCARIHYDLLIEELLPNGQTKRIRKPGFVKLNDGSEVQLIEHETELKVLSHEVKLVSCSTCDMMD